MITLEDLQAAIAECEGVRNPTSSTCIKLAAFYTIKNELFGAPSYSYAPPPVETYQSDSEFSQAIQGKDTNDVLKLMDELVTTLSVVNPRLYASVMRRLRGGEL